MLSRILVVGASLSLIASPAVAQSTARAPAPLSVQGAPEPGGETVEGMEARRGFILPILGITALILAILALTNTWPFDDDGNAFPTSP